MTTNENCILGLRHIQRELDSLIIQMDSERNHKAYKKCIDASNNMYESMIFLMNDREFNKEKEDE